MSDNNRTAKGIFWSAIERFSMQGILFVQSIILARLLSPSDYGLVTMLTIFLAIAQSFIDSGFSNALIQKQGRTEIDYSTVFYFNIVVGIVLYLLLFASSRYIADFYSEPLLSSIVKVSGLSIIINSFGVVQYAKLSISLNFKRQAISSLTAVTISGIIGISLAYCGYGVWSLVVQSLLNNFLNIFLLWLLAKWRPLFCFSMESFRSLFSYGSKLLFSGLLHTIYINLYSLAIGKKMNSYDLGIYKQAHTFSTFPSTNITNIIHKAMFPVLCSIQDDEKKLETSFLIYIRTTCYIIFPLMTGLAALSDPFIKIVLTEKWIDVVPILQILCAAFMWDPLMRINNYLLYVKGRTDYTLKAEVIKKVIAFIILFSSISFGLYIIASGLILYSFIDIFIITRFTCKVSGITLRKEIKIIFPIFLLALSMGVVVRIVIQFIISPYIQLMVGVLSGISYYFLVSKLFGFDDLPFLLRTIKNLRNKYNIS